MTKISGFHEGDRSELYAIPLLSTVAHVVPVPRVADYFSVDLFAHLVEPDNKTLGSMGLTICMQVKSDFKDVCMESEEDLTVLNSLANPFFIAVMDKSTRTLSIFSTLFRFLSYWDNKQLKVTFDVKSDQQGITCGDAVSGNTVRCGKPIVIAKQDDLDSEDPTTRTNARKSLRECLKYWATLENTAIAWRVAGIPMSPTMPADYIPGQIPEYSRTMAISWSPDVVPPLVSLMENVAFAMQTICMFAEKEPSFSAKQLKLLEDISQHVFSHREKMSALRRDLTLG